MGHSSQIGIYSPVVMLASMLMYIYGLDFTSAPTRRKPITCACCELYDTVLTVNSCLKLTSFDEFEAFLRSDGPWLAALDFPFGQPRKLIANLGWPQNWRGYMEIVASKIGR